MEERAPYTVTGTPTKQAVAAKTVAVHLTPDELDGIFKYILNGENWRGRHAGLDSAIDKLTAALEGVEISR